MTMVRLARLERKRRLHMVTKELSVELEVEVFLTLTLMGM